MNNMKNQIVSQNLVNQPVIKVYFDGLCKVCRKEIDHYRKQRGADHIEFIDICHPSFSATDQALDPKQIHRIMHVRRQDGSLATRVDAFIEIWCLLPRYHWLAKLAKKKFVKSALELGYTFFTFLRPYLPRSASADDCQDSPYCEVKHE